MPGDSYHCQQEASSRVLTPAPDNAQMLNTLSFLSKPTAGNSLYPTHQMISVQRRNGSWRRIKRGPQTPPSSTRGVRRFNAKAGRWLSQCYLPTHIPDCNGWRSGLPMKSDLGMEGRHHRDRRVQGCVGTDIALGSGSIRSMAQAYQVVFHRHGCSFSPLLAVLNEMLKLVSTGTDDSSSHLPLAKVHSLGRGIVVQRTEHNGSFQST